jgi:hypothetical protein
MYISLGVPIALSFAAILIGFKSINEKTPTTPTVKPKLAQPQPVTRPQLKPAIRTQSPAVARQELRTQGVKAKAENTTGVTCPNCKKVFGRPLVMLNFEDGKNSLVNVCPYCSHVLGNADT